MTCSIISTCAGPCWIVGPPLATGSRGRSAPERRADRGGRYGRRRCPVSGSAGMESEGDVGAMKETDPAHFRRAGKRALRTLGGEHSLCSPFVPGRIEPGRCEARASRSGALAAEPDPARSGRATLPAPPRTRASSRPGPGGRSVPAVIGTDREPEIAWSVAVGLGGGAGRPRRVRPQPLRPAAEPLGAAPPVALYIRFRL